jgi:hypothetical protein
MGSFTGYVVVYVLGGVTFIPLVIALLVLHAYLTLKPPVKQDDSSSAASLSTAVRNDNANNGAAAILGGSSYDVNSNNSSKTSILLRPNDDQYSLKSGTDVLAEKFHRSHDSDVAAGFFAVCRDYVPGGVNGKPPERTTPAGEVVGNESPSVYQSMYRSIFERKQPSASIEPANNNGKNFKKARNVFYIVLRYVFLLSFCF